MLLDLIFHGLFVSRGSGDFALRADRNRQLVFLGLCFGLDLSTFLSFLLNDLSLVGLPRCPLRWFIPERNVPLPCLWPEFAS